MDPTPLLTAVGPQDWRQWVMIAAGAGLLGYFYLKSRQGKRPDPLSRGPRQIVSHNDLARQRATERQLEGLMVELEQMSRQISAQLDTRMARLEALLAEADEKLARLESAPSSPSSPSSTRPAADLFNRPAPAPPPAPEAREPRDNRDEGTNLYLPPEGIDRTTAKIYGMADAGVAHGQIALEVDRPLGEVDLILALRPRSP